MRFDDLDKDTQDEFKRFKDQVNSIPESLKLTPISNKFSEESRVQTQWLSKYLNFRKKLKNEAEIKSYLNSVGKNASDFASRFRGCLLGLAVGDALGTTLEFKQRDESSVIDIIGQGPFNLEAGQWTDDTSMALCLAYSLLRKQCHDAKDQMDLYTLWWQHGALSVNGKCFDIGNTVIDALQNYQRSGNPISGSTHPHSAGNGSIMRLAPIVMFYCSSPAMAIKFAGESSKTTHGAQEAIDACYYLAALLQGALMGQDKNLLLSNLYEPTAGIWKHYPLSDRILDIANGSYKQKARDEIKSSGYVVDTLEAALWAFNNSDSFTDGALLAVNLAGDADTIGAVYGQIAGAYYGEYNMPINWISKLHYSHIFYQKAEELMAFGLCDI
ncbi:ADP-ribosylglycohydrolase family protein [Zooshikella ganghwensis]|uniref:ADP-ribosylglycohydrolase family protein n=1 Tax=Zooshikella ganghwensis TaxID=202772 RepID=UPI000402BEB2|nr:ADP-ribosylglycohydrolase family protein [Zooshikella ganghwensis]